jgi:hypothetical protein
MSRENRFWALAAGIPTTVLVTVGHPLLAAAALGVTVTFWAAHLAITARERRDLRLVDPWTTASYEETPAPRRPSLRLVHSGGQFDDELEEFDPLEDDNGRPWVYLRQREDW